MTSRQSDIPAFQPLGSFEPPVMPTADALQLLTARMRRIFSRSDDQPFIADDRLQRSTQQLLDDLDTPPLCEPLLDELQTTLGDWAHESLPKRWLQPIVLPPCDHSGTIAAWARAHGHELLPPPERSMLLMDTADELLDLSGEGVLVIPELERWFLRHRSGLALIRLLLNQLDGLERHCVIGCNSWAWAFLRKAVNIHMILPNALTFQPFDTLRLHRWFVELAGSRTPASMKFRLSESGEDVLALDKEGKPGHDYFDRLAARSLGIPWVARHLWRRSLRSRVVDDDEVEDAKESTLEFAPDEQTLWVVALEEFSLPGSYDESALLILQALLIHHSLTRSI